MRLIDTIRSDMFPSILVRVYRDPDLDEYVCRLFLNGRHQSDADAFDTDLVAALGTAGAMFDHATLAIEARLSL